ncbi:hypothetical protein R0D69_26315, partial [Pseudomonas aeruginosa]|nr:hypothetical protein [Pseudomonas aeruginosa]
LKSVIVPSVQSPPSMLKLHDFCNRAVDGKADLMMTDAIEARLQSRLHPELCAVHPQQPFDFAEKAYLLPRDEAFKRYVDQWLHIAEQSGLLRQRMEHWLEYRWPTAHGK